MISDGLGQKLHDRATRGAQLSPEEKEKLETWYARQDDQEAKELNLEATSDSTTVLRAQVNTALAQLAAVTERIRQLATENDNLRRENALLRAQLAQRVPRQIA